MSGGADCRTIISVISRSEVSLSTQKVHESCIRLTVGKRESVNLLDQRGRGTGKALRNQMRRR